MDLLPNINWQRDKNNPYFKKFEEHIHDYLELNTNAIVNGSVEYDIIVVHEGSEINGNLKFIKNKKKKIAPKKDIKQKIRKSLKKFIIKNTVER